MEQPQQDLPGGDEPREEEPTPTTGSSLSLDYPEDTNGIYMVLAAKVPERGPLRFRELGFTPATGPAQAKEIASEDKVHGPRLTKDADDSGIVLRAVPAKYWPETKPTEVEVQKRLVLR